MLIIILEVILLLGVIIIPLRPQKKKPKKGQKLHNNTSTKGVYGINSEGDLEKIQRTDLIGEC